MKLKIMIGTLPIDHALEIQKECRERYWGKGVYLELRGRGNRLTRARHNDLPLKYAPRAKVYLVIKKDERG